MKKFCILITLFLLIGSVYSQKLPITSQYFMNRYVLSPSYSGLDDGANVFAGYRDQWVDFKGAPVTKFINIYGPVGKSVGVGGMFTSDQEGVFNRTYGELAYAYHLKLADEHELSFSMAGKFFQSSISLDQAVIQDLINDDVLQTKQTQNETRFNAGASILYRFMGLNVSLSAPYIIENKSQYYNDNNLDADESYLLRRHFMAHASYDLNLMGDMLQITPYAIIRMATAAPLNYEFAAQAKYNNFAWLGISYRKEGTLGVSAGFELNEQVAFNYTYEFMGNGMTGNSNGTHELGIGLSIGTGLKAMKEKQKKSQETADSLSSVTEKMKKTMEEQKEEAEKERKKVEMQLDILQQRLNDAELELGKLKNITENSGLGEETDLSNLTEEEKIKRQKELDDEILDIERKLRDVGGEFFVVVEAFKVPENAKKAITLWADRDLRVNMIYNEVRDFYYIYAGKYPTYNQALELKNKLKDQGIFGWIYLWAH